MKIFRSALTVNRGFLTAFILTGIGCFALPGSGRAAILVVTNSANNGAGTLRALLPTAHDGDVITFAVTGLLTNVVSGGLTISNSVSIVGPGLDLLTITGTNRFPAFQVKNGVTSSISGLTFYRAPGAINNSANLTVSNCFFTSCYGGGGLNNSSNLLLVGCTFADCHGSFGSSTYSEAVPGTAGGSGGNGGAIVNSGSLSALNCQFLTNTAGWGGDGTSGDVPSFYHGVFNITTGGNGGNGGHGGAVYDVGTAAFTNCTFAWNTSGLGGAGGAGGSGSSGPAPQWVYSGPGRHGGNAGNAGNGGAIYSASGAKFVSCTFFNNTTGSGGNGGNGGNGYLINSPGVYPGGSGGNAGNAGSGTIYCTGACQIAACTFLNNTASPGGNAGNGGNGTYFNNSFNGPGGSGGNAGSGGSGGAIYGPHTNAASFTLRNVLTAGNTCGYAGSAGYAGSSGSGAPTGSTDGTNGLSAGDGTGPELSGIFTSLSHNLISLANGSTGFTNAVRNDIVGTDTPVDALVAGLADNHGPVLTCTLTAGSPALDAGDDTLLASNVVTDARGYARKSGAHVDIGAYEHQAPSAQINCRAAVSPNGAGVSLTNTPGALFTVLGTTDFTLPLSSWDVLGQMTEISPGQFQWIDPDSANYDFRFFSVRSP